jgi:NADPH-dependent ferric siderophore reductase
MTLMAEVRVCSSSAQDDIARLCAAIAKNDPRAVCKPEMGRAEFPWGLARMRAERDLLVINAEAADEDALATMKFVMATRLDEIATARKPQIIWTGDGTNETVLPNFSEMRVRRWRDVTPHMRRITLAGGGKIGRFVSDSVHIRVLIPPTALAVPEWPVPGPDGRPKWPADDKRPASRLYTVRSVDLTAGEIDVDFVLHETVGVASSWAMNVTEGAIVGITGPGGRKIPGDAGWYLLAGDETAIPAMARMLERFPEDARGVALIEVADGSEEQALTTRAQIEIRWVHRNGAAPGNHTLLEDAIRAVTLPEKAFTWIGAEQQTVRAIRDYWRKDLALKNEDHYAMAYWTFGKSQGGGLTGNTQGVS